MVTQRINSRGFAKHTNGERGAEKNRTSRPSGFTLIELLTTVVIITLLLGLLLPAVQYARELSRRSSCASNLRQICLGVMQYESTFGIFPYGNSDQGSYLVAILPYIEQQSLAEEIRVEFAEKIATFKKVFFPLLKCPSDPASASVTEFAGSAGTNYFGSSGSYAGMVDERKRGFDGIFVSIYNIGYGSGPVRAAQVTDGLSSTSCLSETLHADGTFARLRVTWNTPHGHLNYKDLSATCRSIPINPKADGWVGDHGMKGVSWISGGHMKTLFNHVCVPNSPSCFNRGEVATGASSVASYHSGICNLAFADGHVANVDANINADVWFAFGSKASGD